MENTEPLGDGPTHHLSDGTHATADLEGWNYVSSSARRRLIVSFPLHPSPLARDSTTLNTNGRNSDDHAPSSPRPSLGLVLQTFVPVGHQ